MIVSGTHIQGAHASPPTPFVTDGAIALSRGRSMGIVILVQFCHSKQLVLFVLCVSLRFRQCAGKLLRHQGYGGNVFFILAPGFAAAHKLASVVFVSVRHVHLGDPDNTLGNAQQCTFAKGWATSCLTDRNYMHRLLSATQFI